MPFDLLTFDVTAPRHQRDEWRKLLRLRGEEFPVWDEWFAVLSLAQMHAVAETVPDSLRLHFPGVHTAQLPHDVVRLYGRYLTTYLATAWEPFPTQREMNNQARAMQLATGLLAHVRSNGYAYLPRLEERLDAELDAALAEGA